MTDERSDDTWTPAPHLPQIEEDWFEHTFADLYPILYAHRSLEAAKPEAIFAIETLLLSEDERILDLCCGGGRHMYHLLKHIRRVTGLDYSKELLVEARTALGSQARLVRGDMRRLPFQNEFDAVCNFFTSFGYFADDKENVDVVRGIAKALRPAGKFFIDFMNRDHVATHVVPVSQRAIGEYDIQDERWIDVEAERLNKRTTIMKDGHVQNILTESVRLYTAREFVEVLEAGNLKPQQLFGDYDGSPMDPSRPRMIAIGVKA